MKLVSSDGDHAFKFVTNHAHVLQVISGDLTVRLRDIPQTVGITEPTAAQIVTELERAGYLTKRRDGRRNHYEVHEELPLRHPQHRHHTVGDLIAFLAERSASADGARKQGWKNPEAGWPGLSSRLGVVE